MMTRLGFVKGRLPRVLKRLGPDAITLKWTEFTGTPTTDPVTKSKIGTSEEETLVVNGLVHFVHGSTVERRFAEIQAGDAIVDLDASLNLAAKENLRFIIEGVEYVQKEIGDGRLVEIVDALVGGVKFLKPVYLRRAT